MRVKVGVRLRLRVRVTIRTRIILNDEDADERPRRGPPTTSWTDARAFKNLPAKVGVIADEEKEDGNRINTKHDLRTRGAMPIGYAPGLVGCDVGAVVPLLRCSGKPGFRTDATSLAYTPWLLYNLLCFLNSSLCRTQWAGTQAANSQVAVTFHGCSLAALEHLGFVCH